MTGLRRAAQVGRGVEYTEMIVGRLLVDRAKRRSVFPEVQLSRPTDKSPPALA